MMYGFTVYRLARALFVAALLSICTVRTLADGSSDTVSNTPKPVQQALAWELPANQCRKPKAPGQRKKVTDSQGITREEWDVDYYTMKRYNRKETRWKKCVGNYKAVLKDDFVRLKASAQHGLTESQAAIIMGKMKVIQAVLMSPDGLLPTE